jgi:CDP-diacylglycerol--glycerol-3-phosphate 3-phosphatidyltransferase
LGAGPQLLNVLTGARIAAVPVVMFFLCFKGPLASFLGAMVFMAAGVTDFLDGFFARRQRLHSIFGKFMDPLADKLLVSAALIMLIPLRGVPAWIAFVIIGRELAVNGLRAMAAAEGIILAPDRWGKVKTFFQMAALTALILHYNYHAVDFQRLGMGLLWLALIVTVASGVGYFLAFFRQYPESQKS